METHRGERDLEPTAREQRATWFGMVVVAFLLACGLGVLTTLSDDTDPSVGVVVENVADRVTAQVTDQVVDQVADQVNVGPSLRQR